MTKVDLADTEDASERCTDSVYPSPAPLAVSVPTEIAESQGATSPNTENAAVDVPNAPITPTATPSGQITLIDSDESSLSVTVSSRSTSAKSAMDGKNIMHLTTYVVHFGNTTTSTTSTCVHRRGPR